MATTPFTDNFPNVPYAPRSKDTRYDAPTMLLGTLARLIDLCREMNESVVGTGAVMSGEFVALAQEYEYRAPEQTPPGFSKIYQVLFKHVPFTDTDRLDAGYATAGPRDQCIARMWKCFDYAFARGYRNID